MVIRRLAREVNHWPELTLSPLDTTGLSPLDARLATALYAETVRRWLTLEFLLNIRLSRPLQELEPKMQAVFLAGACQVFFFDQIPDHAAVDESVAWASANIRPKAGGMVNAVLRRMAELSLGRSAPRPDHPRAHAGFEDDFDDDEADTGDDRDAPTGAGATAGDDALLSPPRDVIAAEVTPGGLPELVAPDRGDTGSDAAESAEATPPSSATGRGEPAEGAFNEAPDVEDGAEERGAYARPPSGATAATGVRVDPWRSRHSRLPTSDGRAVLLAEAVLPHDRLERLAVQTSHPLALVRRWSDWMSFREVEDLALHNLVHPPTILAGVNPELLARFGPVAAPSADPADGASSGDSGAAGATISEPAAVDASAVPRSVLIEPHREPGFAVWVGEGGGLTAFLARAYAEGLGEGGPANLPGGGPLRVQDPASAEPVTATAALRLRPDDIIVDLCAGMGTKTLQLRALHPQCRIIASDPDDRRAESLAERFAGDERVWVVPPRDLIELAGRAALVVMDVPCSNTAVLARRVEAKYRADPEHLGSLVALQRQIIIDGLRLRRSEGGPRGALLYSTCSLEPAENEEQRRWMTRQHRELRVRAEGRRQPSGGPGGRPSDYSDGGYHVLLD